MPLKLYKGIRHFKNHAFVENRNLFSALTQGQNPDILFITCSDSRIIPSSITHAEYGDLFVIRNAGNIVPPYSPASSGEGATIEYALKKLNVKEIIVCGHSKCGAMEGLLDPNLEQQLPAVAAWLTHAKPVLLRVEERQLSLGDNAQLKLKHMTHENILLSLKNLKTYPSVKEKLETNQVLLHGWYYDIQCGEIFIYKQESNAFIPFETAVTELFNSDLVRNKMRTIVEEEAAKYLNSLSTPKTAELYLQFSRVVNEVALKGVASIWEPISKAVRLRLWAEFGELCEELKGSIDPRFTALLQKAQEVKLTHVRGFQEASMSSLGYRQFCSQVIRANYAAQLSKKPPLELSESEETQKPLARL